MKLNRMTGALAFGLFTLSAGKVLAQAYPELTNKAFQPAPGSRDQQELGEVIGIGAPGAIDEINKRLIERTIKSPFSSADLKSLIQQAEAASQNIQNGSSPASVGTTSLVSKAVSSILGIAEEAGAVSSSTTGSTTTLTANIPQFFDSLEPAGQKCFVISDGCSFRGRLIRGASASVSINSSSSTTPSNTNLSTAALAAVAGTNSPAFSGFTLQENLVGRKNHKVTADQFQKSLDSITSQSKNALLSAYSKVGDSLHQDPKYTSALEVCVKNLNAAATPDLPTVADQCINSFVDVAQNESNISSMMTAYVTAETSYNNARNAALKTLFYPTTFTVEYDFANVLNQPSQSTYKVVYGYQSPSGAFQTTANGSTTLYNSLEGSTQSRVRSTQAAIQLDYKPALKSTLQYALGGGYYFQYMVADGLLTLPSTAFAPGTTIPLPGNASVLLNTTGPIHVGQGKLTLSLKGTSISIPLALTVSNRTDLIKATRVSGNFGVSYDFSSLLSSK